MIKIKHFMYQEDLSYVANYIKKNWYGQGKQKLLIIGATGLIGSFLADTIIYYNKNFENRFELYLMGRSLHRLKERFQYALSEDEQSKIYLWEHDISVPFSTEIEFDYIFHLASNADPGTYAAYPLETIVTNVQGSINVLQYAKEHTDVHILFTSSMEVYGENDGHALEESDYGALNYNCLRNGYPESKKVSELLYKSALEEYGIKSNIARIGYVYGPTMLDSDNKVVAEFIKDGVKGKNLFLKSSGTRRRTYCYVADVVTGVITIVAQGKLGETYNVADKHSQVTIKQLGEIVSKQAGVNLIMERNPQEGAALSKDGDRVLNCSKLEQLGWQARTDIKSGIYRTIALLKQDGALF